jgi:putative ABC transport system substrate-binding protein
MNPFKKRRTLIGASALLLAGRDAFAQPVRKIHRIGIFTVSAAADFAGPQPAAAQAKALLRGLGELGYVYGQHYVTEARSTEGKQGGVPAVAAELAGLGMDVIVAAGPTLVALKAATATIPVVMAAGIDPVGDGLIQSLGRPGTNFTGLSHQFADGAGKLLELLKELVPGTAPVAVLWDRGSRSPWEATQVAAKSRGWKLLSLEIKDAGEIEAAFKTAAAARAGALLVLTGHNAFPNRQRITELAARYRLPAMFDLRPYVDAGGLISYGADLVDLWRQSARFIDKILKGAKPADLPVEQPTRFELIINLKTAKAIGLTIPPAMRLRVDEVIE